MKLLAINKFLELLPMINKNFFLKLPVNFNNKCKIYPPSINDIIGNENFPVYQKILTFSQEELEDEFLDKTDSQGNPLKVPTPIEYLFCNSYNDKEFENIAKQAFEFFIKEEVTFLYETKSILIGNIEQVVKQIDSLNDLIIIKEEEFFDFQNLIRESIAEKPVERPNLNEDPRVKRIKAKARYRDKIKAKKGMGISLETTLVSICCMGIGITPLNIGEMSYVAACAIMERYQEKENYHIDIDTLLAGSESKKIKPKYWIRNLD